MRESFAASLCCPHCLGPLTLAPFSEAVRDGKIHRGWLLSACGEAFPIINGIPRLLMGPLRSIALADYPEFFKNQPADRLSGWQSQGPVASQAEERVKAQTAASFGYEWSEFARMLPVYESNFRWYTEPLGSMSWKGLRVMDAGCGTGRHTFHAAAQGARVVAVDLSRAIDVAARNTEQFETIDFVQADLCQLPFATEQFDVVHSLGVLHHLPDPAQGFRSLARMLVPGGRMLVYLYWNLEGQAAWRKALLAAVNALRGVTRRMSFQSLKRFSLAFSAVCYAGLVVPGKALGGRFGRALPLAFYQDYPFCVLYNDTFDRFSAPVERRYSSREVKGLFSESGLKEIRVLGGAGWRAVGLKTGLKISTVSEE